MLRVYLKHEGHDGVLVNGDAAVAYVNDGRAGGLANSEDIAGFATAAKWIDDGRASSQTQDSAQDGTPEQVLSDSCCGYEKTSVAPDSTKRQQAEVVIQMVFRRQWFTMPSW